MTQVALTMTCVSPVCDPSYFSPIAIFPVSLRAFEMGVKDFLFLFIETLALRKPIQNKTSV
jgi:hypothetical protein